MTGMRAKYEGGVIVISHRWHSVGKSTTLCLDDHRIVGPVVKLLIHWCSNTRKPCVKDVKDLDLLFFLIDHVKYFVINIL